MDVINNAGNVLDNILAGWNDPVDAGDFLNIFASTGARVIDIRGEREAVPFIAKYGERWLNLPQDQLRRRWEEIPRDETFYLLCDTGPRSYEAQVFLRSRGLDNTRNIQGGFAMIRAIDPGFLS